MPKLNRRTFLKLLGQGSAALGLGMGLSGKAMAKTGSTGSRNVRYQTFQPGEYFDWEREMVEERFALAKKGPQRGSSESMNRSGGPVDPLKPVTEEDILNYNRKWDPYNPLFNNKEYAQKAGYPGVPAWPCFQRPSGSHSHLTIPEDYTDKYIWLYGHGPDDIEMFSHIFADDYFTAETKEISLEDITIQGSDLRHFRCSSTAEMYNRKGELVVRSSNCLRNGYKRIIDGSPYPSYSQLKSAFTEDLHPAHYTTDEEWEYIKELWRKEYTRGSQKLYWEDVTIGDEPAWVCSNPISYMDMIGWYGFNRMDPRPLLLKTPLKKLNEFRDRFGNILMYIPQMYGTRNIVGSRCVMYNDTAAKVITRLVTNYIGDAGLTTRIGWMFQQNYPEMRYAREGGEYLDKVSYMKGKGCNAHGSEGDTVIGKGYVTNKYKNDKGEGIIDLVCWGETLDNRIITVVPAAAKLPLKKG